MKLTLIATATFGLEAVVRREIETLGMKVLSTENGKVTFEGDERALIRANLWLRTADRVQLKMAEFIARESEELFQQVKGIPWENLIPPDGKFTVLVSTVKSRLRSEPNNQKTVKKAIVERLSDCYGMEHFPETGAAYTVKATLLKDRVTITVDTTGPGLHKRGYRVASVPAPVKETLAAAMVELSFWNPDRFLLDPCCGSGTIPIEAALIARNIAPGLSRHFACEDWEIFPPGMWKEERQRAFQSMDLDKKLQIYGSDISREAIEAARRNAEEAGVEEDIVFERCDIGERLLTPSTMAPSGIIITNPPYGERIGDREQVDRIFRMLHRFMSARPDWSLFLISPDRQTEEKVMGRRSDRRRKLYNGRIEVNYYQFHGKRPERKSENGKERS